MGAVKSRLLCLLAALVLAGCQAALGAPIVGPDGQVHNEITNGTFDNGLNGWECDARDVVAAVVGNPAPAAQCNHSIEGWGDRMRQVIDDTLNPLWNPSYHVKVIDLQADIALLTKDHSTGGVRFRLDYWDEIYNGQNEAPAITDPGYHVTDWVEYKSNQEFWFTTVNPFDRIVLPIQPRWISVEIEFLQPPGTVNLVDNVTLTSKCVPEPGAIASLATGLLGLVGLIRYRRG